MLILRQEQLDLFARIEMGRFEDRVIAHLRQYYTERMAGIPAETAREFVRFCVRRAARYGIERERDIVLFIDVAIALGQRFDELPQHQWAVQILTDEFLTSPGVRIEALHRRTVEYLAREERRAA